MIAKVQIIAMVVIVRVVIKPIKAQIIIILVEPRIIKIIEDLTINYSLMQKL